METDEGTRLNPALLARVDRSIAAMRDPTQPNGWMHDLLDDMVRISRRQPSLSDRMVLWRYSLGDRRRDVADYLGISAWAVTAHERHARMLLGAPTMMAAVATAIREELIP